MRVTSQGAGTSREKAYLKVNSTALITRAKSRLRELLKCEITQNCRANKATKEISLFLSSQHLPIFPYDDQ